MKRVLGVVFSLILVLSTGCGTKVEKVDAGNTQTAQTEQTEQVEKEVTINVTYKDVTGYDEWFENTKVEFEKTYPNVKVKLSKMPSNEGDYNTKTSLMLQTDDTIDVMVVDSFLAPTLVASQVLASLPTADWADWNEQYSESIRNGMTFDGKVYAIPYTTDTRGLYYNTVVFEKAGLSVPWEPKSWNEVIDAVKVLDEAGVAYPIWMSGSKAQGEGTTMQTFEMLMGGTDDWIFEEQKWVVTSTGMKDALGFIQELKDLGIYDNTELATMLDANAWQVLNEKMISSEDLGIDLDGSWKGGDWQKGLPDTFADVIKIAKLPNRDGDGYSSMSGGWTLAVPELSDAKVEAFNFIKIALNKDNIVGLTNASGDMAVRKDVVSSQEYIDQNVYRAEMSTFADFTKFRPGVEAYPSVSIEIQSAVEAVITGQMTAEEAMEVYAENVKNLVGEGNWIEK